MARVDAASSAGGRETEERSRVMFERGRNTTERKRERERGRETGRERARKTEKERESGELARGKRGRRRPERQR